MDTPNLGKNRLHIDVNASGGITEPIAKRKEQVNSHVEHLLGLGARKQRELEDADEYYIVMLDPKGNEFCIQ